MRPEHETILTGTAPDYEQAITVDAKSTSEFKIGANAGAGEVKRFLFTVTETFTETDDGTDGTVIFSLQHSTTSGSGYADLVASAAIGTATLVEGYQFTLDLPPVHNAWIQAYFNVSETYDGGKVNVALMKDIDSSANFVPAA